MITATELGQFFKEFLPFVCSCIVFEVEITLPSNCANAVDHKFLLTYMVIKYLWHLFR